MLFRSVSQSRYSGNFLSGLVAYWDISESSAPFVSKMGSAGPVELVNGPGSNVTKVSDGPTGHALNFNGTTDYLICPAAQSSPLNIGMAGGNKVTVLAFFKPTVGSSNDFIAGTWQEDDNNPRRQYGLFYGLGVYGGTFRSCYHTSKNGGPSPGRPFSVDYSANGFTQGDTGWHCLSGTYDGAQMISYINASFEPFPLYQETAEISYSKNPYLFPDGLNSIACDFTVGAVKLTSGMGNFASGRIAAVMVFNRSLSPTEISRCQRLIDSGNIYGFRLSLFRSNTVSEPVSIMGCNAYTGVTCVDQSNTTANNWLRNTSSGNAFIQTNGSLGIRAFVDPYVPSGITTDNLESISVEQANVNLADRLRLMIRVNGNWYATEAEFGVDIVSTGMSDWANSKVGVQNFARTGPLWRDVTLNPGVALTLAASARTSDIPSGTVEAIGVIKATNPVGSMRFRNFVLKTKEF